MNEYDKILWELQKDNAVFMEVEHVLGSIRHRLVTPYGCKFCVLTNDASYILYSESCFSIVDTLKLMLRMQKHDIDNGFRLVKWVVL
jgi:hypothetical protein